jgi:hypothetical protein
MAITWAVYAGLLLVIPYATALILARKVGHPQTSRRR